MKVKIIKLSDIEFGNRQREDYGDINELSHSIKKKGMITPMAVKLQESSKPYLLIAGGRRFKAATLAKLEEVPVRIYERELTELDFKEIELFENIHRKDLEWKERVFQEREIHLLQVEKYGEKISKSSNAPGHTLKDTGDLIGKSDEHVRQSIIIANTVDKFPELFDKARNKSDATKIVKNLGEQIVKQELVKRVKEEESSKDKMALGDNFILKSFFHGSQELPDNYFNLVEIDPPYAIDLHNQKYSSNNTGILYGDSYNEISPESYPEFMKQTLKVCYQKMVEHSWLICWFGPEPWFENIYSWIREAGFECSRIVGIWKKYPGQNNQPNLYLSNSYEMFFYARKGQPTILNSRSNIFDIPPLPPTKKVHPTERPIELMKEIYSTFTFPGSKILIPFLGSGNGILTADELGMSAVGFELGREFRDSFLLKIYDK